MELAAPTSQHVDAIRHALGVMKQDGVEPDILVVLLANSGIVKTEWIEESITQLLKMKPCQLQYLFCWKWIIIPIVQSVFVRTAV